MWLKEKMKNMSQGTEQLLFCIYSVVFLIIMLIGFTGDYFIIDLLFFPAFFFTLFWISRLMRLARENKSQFMKKQPIWKIILVIIIAVLLIKFVKNYGDKVAEETAQRTVKRMMEMKKQAAEKDTIPLIPLVPAKKIDSL